MSLSLHSLPLLTLPAATDVPGLDVPSILLDVADDSVSAPGADAEALQSVVDRARDDAVDLKVVVLEGRLARDSELRDLATTIGTEEGGTVLVLAPGQVGSFSTSVDRVTLEAGQDRAYDADVVVSAQNFVDEVTQPGPPYTLITVALILLVAAVAAATWLANVRRARRTVATAPVAHADRASTGTRPDPPRDAGSPSDR